MLKRYKWMMALAAILLTAFPYGMAYGAAPDTETYIDAWFGEPETLDPAWTYETSGASIEQNIYEGLVWFNREKADDFVPALATEVPTVENGGISKDLLTYTFKIRKGVKFHEGGTLEPHDIAYSIQRGLLQDRVDGPQWLLLEPLLGVSAIEDLAMEIAAVESFEEVSEEALKETCERVKKAVVADDKAGTVTLHLTTPLPPILQILAQQWGAALDMEWMVEQGDWDGKCDNWVKWHDPEAHETVLFDKANGTGPYKLDHWTPGEEIVLIANEDYWRKEPIWEGGPSGPPRLKRVVIKLVEEWSTRFAMLQAGDADHVEVPLAYISQIEPLVKEVYEGGEEDPAKMTILNEDGILKLFKGYPLVIMTPAMFNFNVDMEGGNPFIGSGQLDGDGIPPDFFSDIDLRKAFNYCFDWDVFLKEGLQGEAIQPKGPIIKGVLGYDENQPTYYYDRDKCEAHFKKAWGGQVWEKGFYFQITYNTGNEQRRIAAEIIEQNVEDVNDKFEIAVVNLPWPSYLAARRQGKLPIAISGWLEDYHDPGNWVHPFMHPTAGAYARVQKFPPEMAKEFEELIDKGASLVDPKEREPIYKKLQNLAYEYAIDIFLYQETGREYFPLHVKGWYYNPLYPQEYGYYYVLYKEYPK
ncbi:MAG: ABC transporter substrate-binding protein [Anaerolineae bacterium]